MDSSHEIKLPKRISLNSEIVGYSRFSGRLVSGGPLKRDFGENNLNLNREEINYFRVETDPDRLRTRGAT